MKTLLALLTPTLLLPGLLFAQDSSTLSLSLDNGQTVTISEGPGEARSLGSFAIRRYAAAEPGEETTFFLDGQVQSRDGFVERAEIADLNGDGRAEVVVIVRSAGSGGYLSAHAFSVEPRLAEAGSLEGLPADADPVELLTASPELQAQPASPEEPTRESSDDQREGYSETGRKRGCPPGKRC